MSKDSGQKHIRDLLNEGADFLSSRKMENPRLNAERLLSFCTGLSKVDLYLQFDDAVTLDEQEAYRHVLKRRGKNEPLQYIIGETEFMSLPFRVTPDVLIPRSETEVLVERILEDVRDRIKVRVLDIGVGSGSIAVSIAKYLPAAEVTGVDISETALALARENAERNGVAQKIRFVIGDVQNPLFVNQAAASYDVIVSNPPYISKEEWPLLPEEVREYEPRTALCDDADGLTFYRIIAALGKSFLRSQGRLYFEMGDSQSTGVQSVLEAHEYAAIRVCKDLNGIDRVVCGTVPQ